MSETMTIMIVEDDKYILNFISMTLKKEGYGYFVARTVEEAQSLFYANRPDMILLDLGLPDGDGMEVIRNVREVSEIPIIVVSARQEEREKIEALDAGADDYVTKPFYMGELMARVRVGMRKLGSIRTGGTDAVFVKDGLTVDYEKRKVSVGEEEVHLTPIEYKILLLLIANQGKVLTHNYIIREIWGYSGEIDAGNLRVFMATLRRKIEKDPANPGFILTEIGVGYRFCE
ncbi:MULTISPECIES: response regulator [Extibacter]|uniref:response regulator n=1 Tax=Extibacter TaxID=1918452 RepID=UPI001AA13ACE|nr:MULTISPECIES: response regulator [Extibacter]BDF33041.1 DNA-binding response regulator [Lachnospiraceae bacterium]MBO1720119.1 response regulator [Extibacter sp. GGCC_0201]MCB6200801.1 response regulator [Extibacter muris]MCQ4662132.1 response regulator [Extibacter muris]MCQ4691955.1 response regulator [Extibacter muris]